MLSKINLKEMATMIAGAAIVAAAIYFFMIPSHVSVGSGAALAMVMSNFIPVPVSILTFGLNVFLLVIGFLLVGPEFGGRTVFTATIMPLFMRIFEVLFPDFQSITQDPTLDVLCYILIAGVGLALLFSCNASSGGLDIVAKIMSKYLRMDVGQAMSLSGMLVALSSALFYDSKIVVLSLLGTYFGGVVVDHFIFGLNIKRRVCIISQHLDQMVEFILYDLNSGATINEIIGAYENTRRKEVIAIVDKQEYRKLMDFVRKTDPKAFVTVYAVNELCYQPKLHQKRI